MKDLLLKCIVLFQLVFALYCVREFRGLEGRLQGFQTKALHMLRGQKARASEDRLFWEKTFKVQNLPSEIREVPFADKMGIILSVRDIHIPGVVAPHNAALVAEGGAYLLFFRYDTPLCVEEPLPCHTHIGCVDLDRDFSPTSPCFSIDTKSPFSEDPRVVKIDGKYLLTYNDVLPGKNTRRGMRVAHFDPQTKLLNGIKSFDRRAFSIEKNWAPFSPDGKNLHFIYTISPHQVFKVASPEETLLTDVVEPNDMALLSFGDWSKVWGYPRGGTPPQLVDGEYLSFFHSSFEDSGGAVWYIMGAYTFEATAPFRITKISSCPILFDGIYSATHQNTSNPNVRCIYPAGFVLERRDGKALIQLSCGENDSTIKILTFDKDTLLKSMKSVSIEKREVATLEDLWAPLEFKKAYSGWF